MNFNHSEKRRIGIQMRIMFMLGRYPSHYPERTKLIMEVLEHVLRIEQSERMFADEMIQMLSKDQVGSFDSEIFESELTECSKIWQTGM